MGWNPANWAITDTLQGQEGGYSIPSLAKTAATFVPGVNSYVRAGDAVTNVLGATTSTASAPSGGTPGTGIPFYNLGTGAMGGQTNTGNTALPGGGTYTGTSGGSTGPSYDPADLAYLDSQKSLYESLFGKLDDTRNDGIRNLQDQYRLGLNKANTSRSRALEGYQTQEEDTKRSKVNAFNNVDQNTNSLANSVRRLLGLAGAAGSSAALYDLPAGIAREASRNRGNVMSDFATNMRGLDQARKYSEDDYNALLGDLERQKATGTENFEAGILGQRQNIQNTLADIAARRAKLLGQDPNSALQGYQNQYLNFQDQIQGLPEKYRQAVQARDVAVKPVSLKDYMVDRAAINANRQMGQDPASPYAQFLKKQQEEEQI